MRKVWTVVVAALGLAGWARSSSFSVSVKGSGPPVLFLSDVGCGAGVWQATIDKLSASRTCYALTFPGFAGQPAIKPPLLSVLRNELEQYLADKKLVHPVLVGHGFGGLLALEIAGERPEAVGGLVVVDAPPYLADANRPGSLPTDLLNAASTIRKLFDSYSAEQFKQAMEASIAAGVTDPSRVPWLLEEKCRSTPSAVGEALAEELTEDARSWLPRISCRALIIVASGPAGSDPNGSKMAHYEDQYRGLSQRQLKEVTGAKHFVMVDQSELFWSSLSDFLDQLPKAR